MHKPNDSDTRSDRGWAYLRSGPAWYPLALEDFTKVLKINRHHRNALAGWKMVREALRRR